MDYSLKQNRTLSPRREIDRGRRRRRRGRHDRSRGFRQRFTWLPKLSVEREFLVLCAWLVVVFILGGGARADIESLMVLRPLSVLVLAYALYGLRREHIAQNRLVLGLAVAWIGLHVLQLVPLPPQVWQALPGRGIIAEVDRAAGLNDVWRPLSMVPYATRNAIWAMLAPLAVIVLGVQLTPEQRDKLLPVLLGLGLFNAVLGVLQLLGNPRGQIYFYNITNNGSAVGLFANRNHLAVFLATLPPMGLVWAALRNGDARSTDGRPAWVYWACAAAGIALITPLILIAGSRSGFLTWLFGLLAVPAMLVGWARTSPRGAGASSGANPGASDRLRRLGVAALLLLVVGGLAVLTVMAGRGLAVERLLGSDESDVRFRIFGTLLSMIRLYWPWGSGFGSFPQVYQLHERHELLASFYMNHAHNDWIELVLTGGAPAVALVLVAMLGFLLRLASLLRPAREERSGVLVAWLGLLVLAMLALASISDYPLRVPSLACLAVVAALWASPRRSPRQPGNPSF